jgi:hypothetical protein
VTKRGVLRVTDRDHPPAAVLELADVDREQARIETLRRADRESCRRSVITGERVRAVPVEGSGSLFRSFFTLTAPRRQ